MTVTTDALFRGVDRATFAAAFGDHLRRMGLPAPLNATHRFAAAIEVIAPLTRSTLYWAARISYVTGLAQLDTFDRAFASVFGAELPGITPPSRSGRDRAHDTADDHLRSLRRPAAAEEKGAGLPWATLPSVVGAADPTEDLPVLPERLASPDAALAAKPFDLLDADELRVVDAALDAAFVRWPRRRSRRLQLGASGRNVAYRATLRRARRTGGEVFELVRLRRRTRLRPVVAIVDVSGSMEPFARSYLHLMRALASTGRAEVFAFSTRLTRLTPAMRHRSVADAVDHATAAVGDRFGGTRIASSLQTLLHNPAWNAHLRGGVMLVVSDGADTDDPEQLRARLARLSRITHRIVWVNPRLTAEGYTPSVGGMSAALPFVDAFLPGNSLAAIEEVIDAIAVTAGDRRGDRVPSVTDRVDKATF